MATARLSPTARLLRNSRLFALPQAIESHASAEYKSTVQSETATLPHPIRASIVTPGSSLSKGDWGLKRALPAKSTSAKSSRPVVRINELDTFEHVTDFESAADHTVTLEKFQELNLPISLPAQTSFTSSNIITRHQSPFEANYDNTEATRLSKSAKPDGNGSEVKQFRHSGPWLAGQTEAEFMAYLKGVQKDKPALMNKLRERFFRNRKAELKRNAQDKGESLTDLPEVTEEEFQQYVKNLRADPYELGPVIFELLDLPSLPPVPSERIGPKFYQSPPIKMPAMEYAFSGPPATHPSAGLSYTRTNSAVYNHPRFGPQVHQRPVEARVLRNRGKFKGRPGKAVVGIGGITSEDISASHYNERNAPAGLTSFDSTIPGGAKYYVTPIRASVNTEGRINLSSYRANNTLRTAYGLQEYQNPSFVPPRMSSFDLMRQNQRSMPRLDRPRASAPGSAEPSGQGRPGQDTEDVARNLMRTLSSQ